MQGPGWFWCLIFSGRGWIGGEGAVLKRTLRLLAREAETVMAALDMVFVGF